IRNNFILGHELQRRRQSGHTLIVYSLLPKVCDLESKAQAKLRQPVVGYQLIYLAFEIQLEPNDEILLIFGISVAEGVHRDGPPKKAQVLVSILNRGPSR